MRISDWSSDVCSSDLHADAQRGDLGVVDVDARRAVAALRADVPFGQRVDHRLLDPAHVVAHADLQALQVEQRIDQDRKSVVWGKSVEVRVELGGRLIIIKKKTT